MSQCKGEVLDDSVTSKESVSSGLENIDIESTSRLLTVVQRFKKIALVDIEEALALYADQEAIRKFHSINDHVWLETTPQIGWSFFMSVSVHAVGNVKSQQPIVAFYNPFSDVFLITAWRMDEEFPRMTGVEILMGDWLREGSSILSLVPSWLRTDKFKPVALGRSAAEAIIAFERVFTAESAMDWRKKLSVLEDQKLLIDVNYPATAIMLFNSLANIDAFRTAVQSDNPRLTACRNMTIATIRSAAQGDMANTLLVLADETLPKTQKILSRLKPDWFKTLEVAAVFTGKDGCLVFLSPVFDASGSLSIFFIGKEDEFSPNRIDVVDYTGFYKNLYSANLAEQKEASQ